MMKKLLATLAGLTISLSACAQPVLPSIELMDTDIFMESIDAAADGTVYSGSVKGYVYKAEPGSDKAYPWIKHSEENGILTILGVLADENSNTLWLCSVPNFFGPERSKGVSALIGFDLKTAELKGRYDFPPPASACNDITIMPDGSALASDTNNGRMFRLKPGADALELYGADPILNGIDGLAYSSDGTLYVNNVRTNKLIRVETDSSGTVTGYTPLQVSHELGGPDSLRLIEGKRFIQAESGIGRLSIVEFNGDEAVMTVLKDDLKSSPGATVVGNTAYVIESNIGYLLDPTLKGKEIPPFMLLAVPLQ